MLEFRFFAVIKKESLSDRVIAKVAMTLEKWKAYTHFKQENIVDFNLIKLILIENVSFLVVKYHFTGLIRHV